MEAPEVLAELAELIKAGCGHLSPVIVDAQLIVSSKSASLVIVTEGADGHQEWIVSSNDVRAIEDEEKE